VINEIIPSDNYSIDVSLLDENNAATAASKSNINTQNIEDKKVNINIDTNKTGKEKNKDSNKPSKNQINSNTDKNIIKYQDVNKINKLLTNIHLLSIFYECQIQRIDLLIHHYHNYLDARIFALKILSFLSNNLIFQQIKIKNEIKFYILQLWFIMKYN
jgi:hypothetical protein